MKKFTAIYERVSSASQDVASQHLDLVDYAAKEREDGQAVKFYRDTASGCNYERPEWKLLMTDIRNNKVEKLVVWRLDRLGRFAGATISLLDEFDELGVRFISLKDGLISTTPAGRLMRNMLASFSQFETEVRKERAAAGVAAAREMGRRWGGSKSGRITKRVKEKEKLIIELVNDGKFSINEIAQQLGITRQTIRRLVMRHSQAQNSGEGKSISDGDRAS